MKLIAVNLLILASIIALVSSNETVQEEARSSKKDDKSKVRTMFEDDEDEPISEEMKETIRKHQAEARRQKKLRDKHKMQQEAVRQTIRAASTEECDWRRQPFSLLRGEVCGSHYKVLLLDRKDHLIDKTILKKSFRQLSLILHPDKNPTDNADTAFKLLLESYECLSDDNCKEEYDRQLDLAEQKVLWRRSEMKHKVFNSFAQFAEHSWVHTTIFSNYIMQTGRNIWNWATELTITINDEDWPVGRPLLIGLLLWKGKWILYLQLFSYLIVRANYEMAKRRGLL